MNGKEIKKYRPPVEQAKYETFCAIAILANRAITGAILGGIVGIIFWLLGIYR